MTELEDKFKDFLYCQRKIDLSKRYLHIYANIAVKLYEHMNAFGEIEFLDGQYHKYCGELKTVINNFIMFWTEVMNEIIKEADTLRYTVTKTKLMQMVDITLEVQSFKQKSFTKAFLPVSNDDEREALEEIKATYKQRVKDLRDMKDTINNIDKNETLMEYAGNEFDLSIKIRNEVFTMAHTKIAIRLARSTNRIRTSFEEILSHVRLSLKKLRNEHYAELNKLLDQLYDANKDKLYVSRQDRHRNSDTAEVEKAIEAIRDKIEGLSINKQIVHLEEEMRYWEKRLADFAEIENTIKTLEHEIHNIKNYVKEYEKLRIIELPGSEKMKCCENMGENFRKRLEYLQKTYVVASKALMTFFAIRGRNRILYHDKVGTYAIDDYGHQIYVSNYGHDNNHVKCDGSYVQYTDLDQYYFDKYGRYVLDEEGEKLYQRAPCGSTYKLDENHLLVKTTKDCGHSEFPNPECKMICKDPNDIELLPMVEPVDIKNTMTPEVTKYLWDKLGFILPHALYETGMKQSKNPIYFLAHSLMELKYYKKTTQDLLKLKAQANEYRRKVIDEKEQKQATLAKEWKSKQVKRRKPEETDDSENLAAIEHQRRQLRLADQSTYYDYN